MKKGLLLAGAVFSLGILAQSANAVTIKISEDQVLKFGFRGIIDATLKDKRQKGDKTDLVFGHREARIWAKYKLNKIISYGFQAQLGKPAEPEVFDSFINLAFAPEFNIIAGSYKVPFERHSGLQSGWSVPFPTGPSKGDFTIGNIKIKHVFTNPMADRLPGSGSRSPGLTAWGNIADGMFKDYVGVFDGSDDKGRDGDHKTGFAIRVQFTPTMLGYKPEKGYVLKNTYVGKKDVLTIGFSYAMQGYRDKAGGTDYDDQTSWGVDVMWEQKFGTLVPNLQFGYVNHSSWRGIKDDDRFGWLVQGQLLYAQKIFLGKPAVVAKFVRSECDGKGCEIDNNKPKLTTWGIGVNYYIKGYANRISLAFDNVKLDDVPSNVLGDVDDSYTDVTLSIFYNF